MIASTAPCCRYGLSSLPRYFGIILRSSAEPLPDMRSSIDTKRWDSHLNRISLDQDNEIMQLHPATFLTKFLIRPVPHTRSWLFGYDSISI